MTHDIGSRMRFGVIGTGYWAKDVHAAGIASHPDAQLVGVWGRDPTKAQAVAAAYDAQPYADLDAMLATVDAVAFSVPPQVQAELAPRVAQAGRHLLLEKPLAVGSHAARRVVEAVESAGVASLVFFTERFNPEREAWLDSLRRDGDVLGAEATWLASLRTPDNPFAGSPWRQAEGALWDVGPHALSVVLPVLGAVSSVAGGRGPDDTVHLVLGHASGASSVLHLSLTMPVRAVRFGLEFYREDGWHARPAAPFPAIDAYRAAVGELIATARAGGTRHRCDARFGGDVVDVLQRAHQAVG